MQGIIDESYKPGFFILTGSQNFLMHEKITQTLAGRIALLTLLPLSIDELIASRRKPESAEKVILQGLYPQVQAQQIDARVWCSNYISTYVERDVRQLLNVVDILTFQRFLKLCAARTGCQLNYTELSRDADISPNTVKQWISILQASYIIHLLPPYYRNLNKRVTKQPKLYFYDTSLVCLLLGIKTQDGLFTHPLKGALFESFIISEIIKFYYNNTEQPPLYFWRDVQGNEIDCLIELSLDHVIPIEIKSSQTISSRFFDTICHWGKLSSQSHNKAYIIYAGNDSITKKEATLLAWHQTTNMLTHLHS